MVALLLVQAASVAVPLLLLWLISLAMRDAGIVDIFWGAGFAILAGTALAQGSDHPPRSLLLAGLTALWGLRLAGYLAWRNLGHDEDRRYQAMREQHGNRFGLVSLFTVFGFQGLVMLVVSLPVQFGILEPGLAGPGLLDALGILLWLLGFFFETVGDFQLARFKADPNNKGQVMDGGLWRYTRHPNYFGDFCVWWGLYAVAVAGGAPLWTAVGPALMSFLLLRVSGVALLEKDIAERRPAYAEYIRRTSSFFPRPPTAATKVEEPKVEEPKVEEPKVEEPKVEEPPGP